MTRTHAAGRVEGLPKERPVCQQCRGTLRYFADLKDGVKQFTQWRGYGWIVGQEHPLFCTLRCSTAFAVSSYLGGYRKVGNRP